LWTIKLLDTEWWNQQQRLFGSAVIEWFSGVRG
jgi:hypothetical protein